MEECTRHQPVAQYSLKEFADAAARIRASFAGQVFSDSTELTRADRDDDHGHRYLQDQVRIVRKHRDVDAASDRDAGAA